MNNEAVSREQDFMHAVTRDDLSAVPQDDLTAELEAAAPRKLVNRATVGLAGLVLALGGFIAGAQVQKNTGTSNAAATTGNRGAFPGGGAFPTAFAQNGGEGGGGGQNRSGSATTGTVKLVDGTTVYVQTANGDVITVRTSASTAVELAQKAKLSDLKAGAQVTVEGATGTDGVVTATKVTGTKK
jgi:hypothetical protein